MSKPDNLIDVSNLPPELPRSGGIHCWHVLLPYTISWCERRRKMQRQPDLKCNEDATRKHVGPTLLCHSCVCRKEIQQYKFTDDDFEICVICQLEEGVPLEQVRWC